MQLLKQIFHPKLSKQLLCKKVGYISSAYIAQVNEETNYLAWPEKIDVDPHHDWTIQLNQELDVSTIHNLNFYVVHDSVKVEGIQVLLNNNQKSVTVEAPVQGYQAGESYFLYVEKSVKSKFGKEIKNPIEMKFTIKK